MIIITINVLVYSYDNKCIELNYCRRHTSISYKHTHTLSYYSDMKYGSYWHHCKWICSAYWYDIVLTVYTYRVLLGAFNILLQHKHHTHTKIYTGERERWKGTFSCELNSTNLDLKYVRQTIKMLPPYSCWSKFNT